MHLQDQRIPLGEYSNTKLNRMSLLSSGNNTVRRLNSDGGPQLLNNVNENFQIIDSNKKLKTSLSSSSVNSPSFNNISKNIFLNESPTNRILKTIIPRRSLVNSNTTNVISTSPSKHNTDTMTNNTTSNSNNPSISDNKKTDYSELSKKLQIRLQFAYYKLQTKQIHKSFSELKNNVVDSSSETINKSSKHRNKISKRTNKGKTKRRKLVVSHGNYKTPAKNHPKIIIDEVTSSDTIISTPPTMIDNTTTHAMSIDSKRTEIMVPHIINTTTTIEPIIENHSNPINGYIDNNKNKTFDTNISSPNNNTTLIEYNTTPIRNSLKHLSRTHLEQILPNANSIAIQETPMRVKAAKSLIQLFSSAKI